MDQLRVAWVLLLLFCTGAAAGQSDPVDDAIGIDLGTTFSVTAHFNPAFGTVDVLESPTGARTTPSMVAVTESGEVVVGEAARNNVHANPAQTFYSLKRIIGRRVDHADVIAHMANATYKVHDCSQLPASYKQHLRNEQPKTVEPPIFWRQNDHGACVVFELGRAFYAYPVEMVVGMLLASVRDNAERKLGKTVRHAVITVPAYFTENQRSATLDAARIAGLEVLRLLPEPTAAALALGIKMPNVYEGEQKNVFVFDLGGGTLDVSILSVSSGSFDVKAVGGDNRCGGDDIDLMLAESFLKKFRDDHPDSKISKQGGSAWSRLLNAAERAKRALSFENKTTVMLEQLDVAFDFRATVTRLRLEEIAAPFFARLIPVVAATMKKARLDVSDIDIVLLAGGSSRIPKVKELLKHFFQRTLTEAVNPDEAIAVGAAILAYKLRNPNAEQAPTTTNSQASITDISPNPMLAKIARLTFQDVASHALGIELKGNEMSVLVEQFTRIPVTKSGPYTTVEDWQPSVMVVVLEGESPVASENSVLGKFELHGIERALAGIPQINVTFSIDDNAILHVVAFDLKTKASVGILLDNFHWQRLSEAEANLLRRHAQDVLSHGVNSKYLRIDPAQKENEVPKQQSGVLGDDESSNFDDSADRTQQQDPRNRQKDEV